ncbi:Fis family transcriptional regulator [Paraglaciecola arctica]|uniref:Fis family transcriptional regulator n=1 Tax=Paraglaciecola arctica TaxID=1128911 RepID=UPI001C06DBE7|nr:Fis family transcriptional regulator [Paraglaciecola arctica]MBU3003371.1 Fis family transcriptional regulator [Paraglaciecola arctica]
MNKTVKKLDNNVVKALTIVCETAKDQIVGFEWLTHSADYSNFPSSLVITCVLDNVLSLELMLASQQDQELRKHIQKQLLKAGFLLKDVRRHVFFDTEEACLLEHNGDWKRRLLKN